MTFDPTTNLIQYDLLTPEQQEELKAWPHGYECYCGNGVWRGCNLYWDKYYVYRGKPAPVVTSVWFNGQKDWVDGPYKTREEADDVAGTSRIAVLRIDTCNGVSTAHLEGLEEAADRIKELKAKMDAAGAKEANVVSKTLDAANEHITTQYGISALGNPIDRSLIIAKIKGE